MFERGAEPLNDVHSSQFTAETANEPEQARSDCSIENTNFLFPGTGKKQVISW
jgi:hypothetical protein